ncbi:MAG TPA: hypothetical protein VFI91_00955 [Longimicrobiaceae bacterium]|nr:hypothetical protein [Longimicrobiaceae bacterium]
MVDNERPGLEIFLSAAPPTILFAERLRDGRIALGTRTTVDGQIRVGELHLLDSTASTELAAWLAPTVEEAWIETVRERQEESLQTAHDLYGEGPEAVDRFASEVLREIPADLMVRALILLVNSIGPATRERLVARLNSTDSAREDTWLRQRLSQEHEAFAFGVSAAALFEALRTGAAEVEE